MSINIVYAIENDSSWFPEGMAKGSHLDNGNMVFEVLEIIPKTAGRMMVIADFLDRTKAAQEENGLIGPDALWGNAT
jgi:hypothetical protein